MQFSDLSETKSNWGTDKGRVWHRRLAAQGGTRGLPVPEQGGDAHENVVRIKGCTDREG